MLSNNISDKNYIAQLTKTNWLLYIENVLEKAFDIDSSLKQANVLVHCPTGDDGSAVLCSLAQIIIDPYYRTFEGFRTLVYKEWLYYQHNFIKRSALLLQGADGGTVNGQIYSNVASDLKASRLQMQAWPNVNNCRDYAPYFIFFLDCVQQLLAMNIHHFQFTSYYLSHIAVNCFTNKHFEMNSPITVNDMVNGKKQSTDDVKLLSIFQLTSDKNNQLFRNSVFDEEISRQNYIRLDPSKISIWKEYFCRFDENKRECMSH
jgi:hypothetical protein